MNKPFDPANQDLIIGEGVTFTGTIAAPGKAIISGAVSGSIAAQDLLVEKAGTITGKVRADTMNVHGAVSNDVACSDNLVIHATGQVSGALQYKELQIERGGRITGTVKQ
jgi:cytoskeletal protein CcmA (bactofilin family)